MKKWILVLLVILSSCVSTFQETSKSLPFDTNTIDTRRYSYYNIVADERLFTVMAFLNIAGYDEERTFNPMTAIRKQIRKNLIDNLNKDDTSVKKWKEYYRSNSFSDFVFVDYAFTLNSTFPFKQVRPLTTMRTAFFMNPFEKLPEMLNDFYIKANVAKIWNDIKPYYINEIDKYSFAKLEDQINSVWKFLKTERQDTFNFYIFPNFLMKNNSAQCIQRDNIFITMESFGSITYSLNVHEYLHTYINDLVEKNITKYTEKLSHYYNQRTKGEYAGSYQGLNNFVSECLVRALDIKISNRDENSLNIEDKWGFNLVKPFYILLKDYQISSDNFSEYLPKLIDLVKENNA